MGEKSDRAHSGQVWIRFNFPDSLEWAAVLTVQIHDYEIGNQGFQVLRQFLKAVRNNESDSE
jgi:hypothetical protein